MKKPAARITALSLSLLLMAGCATTSVAPVVSPAQQAAIALLEQGKSREAAVQLEAEAGQARGAQRSQLLADAAFAWHDAGDSARARTLLAQLSPRQLSGTTRQRHALLVAELALADRQPAAALQALAGGNAQQLPAALQPRWLLAQASAGEANGNPFAAAASRARADSLLQGSARKDNQQAIARLLAAVDDTTLAGRSAALALGDPLYNHAGRALMARGLPLPRAFDADHDLHVDLGKRPPAERDGYRPPVKLAVLLPLSGNLATAAAPVRDGLLAAYYGEYRRRPEIQFFDTRGTAAGATSAYDRAVAAGVDFVVGPLGRDEVEAVFARDPSVPVLALNRGKDIPPAGNIAFSLAPEDDGLMAAEYLRGRERSRAVVIASSDDNGRRAAAAFKERFVQRGGQVLASLSVSDNPADVSAQLRAAGGADAVFLAVKGSQARALAPQLALSGLGGALRVGGSQLAAGTGKAEDDGTLDGIVFPGETWTARGVSGLPDANTLASTLPTARGGAARLFAFGFDAWKLTAYLERLLTAPDAGVAGATGTLYLDGFGNVMRKPAWSVFQGGRVQPIGDGR